MKHDAEPESRPRHEFLTLAAVTFFYALIVLAATWPLALSVRSEMCWGGSDPMQHLWVMRWYKTCLLEGRSPWLCPDEQYPTGAPLGNFSPLHLQAALYLPLSLLTKNDILCYNILWFFGFMMTGLGTYALGRQVLSGRAGACLAGALAMLSTPMRLHACGHLELLYVGTFPLFLAAWTRFVDRPSRGRLLASVAAYVLVAMSAAYFMVLAVFPAALYVAWSAAGAGRGRRREWLRGHAGWLAGFAAAAVVPLTVLFSGHVWAATHGFGMTRPRAEFDTFGAPLWGYLLPLPGYRVAGFLPVDVYKLTGMESTAGERTSYLGLVTIFLLHYAWTRRVRFPRSGYWWAALGTLVVLSLGSSVKIGSYEVSLPSAWLWDVCPPFRALRVPARFNIYASVVASVLAGAGLTHLLGRVRRPPARGAIFAGLIAAAVIDMSLPMGTQKLPAMPACYEWIRARNPSAAVLDAPSLGGAGTNLNAACGYWQALHRLRTSAGYSGHENAPQLNLTHFASPFNVGRLVDPGFLADPNSEILDLMGGERFPDYVWLYLNAHRFDYVVLHQWPGAVPEFPVHLDRLKACLAGGKVYEDTSTAVYDRTRLAPPVTPVSVCTAGWRERLVWRGRYTCNVTRDARLAVFNPDSSRPLRLTVEAATVRTPRVVRLVSEGAELARWTVTPGDVRTYVSPPFRLPGGRGELAVVSDVEERPRRRDSEPADEGHAPFSLRVCRVALRAEAPDPAAVASKGSGPP